MLTKEQRAAIVKELEDAGFTETRLQKLSMLTDMLQTTCGQGATRGDCLLAAIQLERTAPKK